jgi:hypothetical protein
VAMLLPKHASSMKLSGSPNRVTSSSFVLRRVTSLSRYGTSSLRSDSETISSPLSSIIAPLTRFAGVPSELVLPLRSTHLYGGWMAVCSMKLNVCGWGSPSPRSTRNGPAITGLPELETNASTPGSASGPRKRPMPTSVATVLREARVANGTKTRAGMDSPVIRI